MIRVLNSGSGVLLFGNLFEISPTLHEVIELRCEARLFAAEFRKARVVGRILLHLEPDDFELALFARDDALDLCVFLLLAKAQAALRFACGALLRPFGSRSFFASAAGGACCAFFASSSRSFSL